MGCWEKQNIHGGRGHINCGMTMKNKHSQLGMTLVETMVGVGIFFSMCGGMYAFNYQFDRMRYEFQTNGKQTNSLRSLMEQIVWGNRADNTVERRGVWTANTLTINSPTQITYTTDASTVTHSVRQNGQNIEYQRNGGAWFTLYDPNGALPDNASQYFTSLTFTQTALPTVIQIRLVLGEKLYGRWYYASMSTNVDYRNS